MSNENKPIHRIRIGVIGAAIFENRSDEGQTFYNVQFDRGYRDGENWKRTKTFGRDDLLVLAKVADMAHTYVCAKGRGVEIAPDADDHE